MVVQRRLQPPTTRRSARRGTRCTAMQRPHLSQVLSSPPASPTTPRSSRRARCSCRWATSHTAASTILTATTAPTTAHTPLATAATTASSAVSTTTFTATRLRMSPAHVTFFYLSRHHPSLCFSHQANSRRARQPAAAAHRQTRQLRSSERAHAHGEAAAARRLGAG